MDALEHENPYLAPTSPTAGEPAARARFRWRIVPCLSCAFMGSGWLLIVGFLLMHDHGRAVRNGWRDLPQNPSSLAATVFIAIGCIFLLIASPLWLRTRTRAALVFSMAGVRLMALGLTFDALKPLDPPEEPAYKVSESF